MSIGGLTQTERGLICIEAAYRSEERCSMDGYSFCFHSEKLNRDIWSKVLDEEGRIRTFAVIEGY